MAATYLLLATVGGHRSLCENVGSTSHAAPPTGRQTWLTTKTTPKGKPTTRTSHRAVKAKKSPPKTANPSRSGSLPTIGALKQATTRTHRKATKPTQLLNTASGHQKEGNNQNFKQTRSISHHPIEPTRNRDSYQTPPTNVGPPLNPRGGEVGPTCSWRSYGGSDMFWRSPTFWVGPTRAGEVGPTRFGGL